MIVHSKGNFLEFCGQSFNLQRATCNCPFRKFEIQQIRDAVLVEMTDCSNFDCGHTYDKYPVAEINKEFVFSL